VGRVGGAVVVRGPRAGGGLLAGECVALDAGGGGPVWGESGRGGYGEGGGVSSARGGRGVLGGGGHGGGGVVGGRR